MPRTPVIFIHGAWLHALSWEAWAARFTDQGFLALAPGWPREAATAREMRQSPGALADLGLDALTRHYADIARSCEVPPVIIGHSAGGLIAQHLIAADLGRAAVAIAAAPINEIPGHGSAVPRTSGDERLLPLSPAQFHEVLANTETPQESDRLFERYAMPTPRRLLIELGCDGAEPSTLARADTGNTGRGPLLLVSGQEDRLVPDAVTRAVYKQYGDSTAATDLKQFADRAHSLVVDNGWRAVADYVLDWLAGHGIRPLTEER
ncbi:alpha/beta hydrolase [Streptomyces tendae]